MPKCFEISCNHDDKRSNCRFFKFPADVTKWRNVINRHSEIVREDLKKAHLCSCHFVNGQKRNGPTIFSDVLPSSSSNTDMCESTITKQRKCQHTKRTSVSSSKEASGITDSIHRNDKLYPCNFCEDEFNKKTELIQHQKISHEQFITHHMCKMCKKSFTSRSSLLYHRCTHTDNKPHACDQCDKRFTRRYLLLKHQLVHSGEKPYICRQCNKTFASSSNLSAHTLTHTNLRPFLCDLCGAGYRQKIHLVKHIRSHTGERPYACGVCGKAFITPQDLSYHVRVHTGERPYVCEVCSRAFSQAAHLRTLMRGVHGAEVRSRTCDTCGLSFRSDTLLGDHRVMCSEVTQKNVT